MEKNTITEGSTTIYLTSSIAQNKIKEVFYNPVQIFNRDISLLVTKLYIKKQKKKFEEKKKKNEKTKKSEKPKKWEGVNYYDALTASGLRAIRTRLELPNNYIKNITACDLSESAQNIFNKNLHKNFLTKDKKINFILGDTKKVMITTPNEHLYDIIDIDPYGSVIPFLYPALSSITKNGLLIITCTDTRVLFGQDIHKCFYLYRSARGGSDFKEDIGIRILLQTVNSVANSLNKNFKVLLSVQSDFYVRIFLEIENGKKNCWKSIKQNGFFFYCKNCGGSKIERFGKKVDKGNGERYTVRNFGLESNLCEFCNGVMVLNGPLWLDPLYDPEFVKDLKILTDESEIKFEDFLKNDKDFFGKKKNEENQLILKKENILQIKTFKKIKGFLESVITESVLYENPKSFNYETLFSLKGINVPKKLEFFSALKKKGFLAISSFLHPLVFKTNAPDYIIYYMRLAWILEWRKRVKVKNEERDEKNKDCDIKRENEEKNGNGVKIGIGVDNGKLRGKGKKKKEKHKKMEFERNELRIYEEKKLENLKLEGKLDFDFSEDLEMKKFLKKKIARFLPNPEKNWGPKSGAVIIKSKKKEDLKKLKNN